MNRQKPVVLFLIYHGKSHFISSFHLARTIQQTHTVAFAGVEFFSSFVKSQGFTYYPLKTVPFGIGLDEWYNSVTNPKPIHWKTIVDRWTDRLYKLRRKELTQLVLTCNPTHIVVDSMQATDFIVLHKLITKQGMRFGVLHNMLPASYSKTKLPLNSSAITTDQVEIESIYHSQRSVDLEQRWKQRYKYFGLSDKDIVDRRIRRNKIPASFFSKEPSMFYPTLKGVPEFVMMIPEFNFPDHAPESTQHFLGFQIDTNRRDTFDGIYRETESTLRSKVGSGASLVYCSLGTLPASNRVEVVSFFSKVIEATKALSCVLVISFQLSDEEKASLVNGNEHVYLFNSVPQLSILKLASVFITHGGLNSIKESIDAEVPMLICPAYATYDHNGNTARAVYHKLGLRIELNTDETKIEEEIKELMSNSEYKKRLKVFKEGNAKCSLKPFVDFVSS
jgi:zeaxanthin glucosyltransferase